MAILEPINLTTFKTRLGDLDGKGASADIILGGNDPTKFIPNLNASKWDDEAWINLNLKNIQVIIEKISIDEDIKLAKRINNLRSLESLLLERRVLEKKIQSLAR